MKKMEGKEGRKMRTMKGNTRKDNGTLIRKGDICGKKECREGRESDEGNERKEVD